MKSPSSFEAVAVFHDVADLDQAVEELVAVGFARSDVSLLASEAAVEDKLGHRYERVQELEDDPDAPRVRYRTLGVGELGKRPIADPGRIRFILQLLHPFIAMTELVLDGGLARK